MGTAQDAQAGARRILRLVPDCDPTSLKLTAEEGFLLSRIDGATPWRLLCQIGGMEPEEAEMCLESWLGAGYVEVSGAVPEARPKAERARPAIQKGRAGAPRRAAADGPRTIDESEITEGLDINVEVQRTILEFEAALDRPYHELLSVAPDADAKQVKQAYFKLSKEYHPDRYFRRNIAGYAGRLERIFKAVLEAYEILSDPELREELGRVEAATPPQAAAAEGAESAPAKPLTKLERLRQRMPFRIPEHLLEERRQKACEFAHAAEQSERMGRLAEASSSMRIAISFDASNREYRAALVELQAKSAEQRAAKLLEECGESYGADTADMRRVLKLLEDVLLYRPHDPALNHRAASVSLMLDEIKMAREYAEVALEHSPEVAAHHTIMGKVHRAQGDIGHARKEFESAVAIDAEDVEARKELASLRLGRRAAK
jgi:curved DNA-binding protein CbpA